MGDVALELLVVQDVEALDELDVVRSGPCAVTASIKVLVEVVLVAVLRPDRVEVDGCHVEVTRKALHLDLFPPLQALVSAGP